MDTSEDKTILLRRDMLALVDGNLYAALMLDSLAIKAGIEDGAGSTLAPDPNYAFTFQPVLKHGLEEWIIKRVSRDTARRVMQLLERKGFITLAHSEPGYPSIYYFEAMALYEALVTEAATDE